MIACTGLCPVDWLVATVVAAGLAARWVWRRVRG